MSPKNQLKICRLSRFHPFSTQQMDWGNIRWWQVLKKEGKELARSKVEHWAHSTQMHPMRSRLRSCIVGHQWVYESRSWTPFYHFLRSATLVANACLLDDIYVCYIGNDTFKSSSKHLVCMDEDFSRILGLPYHGTIIDIAGVSHHISFYTGRLHGY